MSFAICQVHGQELVIAHVEVKFPSSLVTVITEEPSATPVTTPSSAVATSALEVTPRYILVGSIDGKKR